MLCESIHSSSYDDDDDDDDTIVSGPNPVDKLSEGLREMNDLLWD